MRHFGDITKLRGADLPTVDVVTGGSPCQNLSLAGKRDGLDGDRSVLFREQIRILKEMREESKRNGKSRDEIAPRYMVWENVPGAFSTNKGHDFQTVLTEIIRIAEPDAPDVPMPEKGKWKHDGYIYDELGRWSVAWRVHDAQFWGVPQRRKRVAVLADFNGLTAGEIMFDPQYWREAAGTESDEAESDSGTGCRSEVRPEREGLSGNSEPSGTARENSTGSFESGADRSSKRGGITKAFSLQGNGIDRKLENGCNGKGWAEDVCYTLNTIDRHAVYEDVTDTAEPENSDVILFEPRSQDGVPRIHGDISPTLNTCGGGNDSPAYFASSNEPTMIEMTSTKNTIVTDGISPTLTARMGTGGNQVNAVFRGD